MSDAPGISAEAELIRSKRQQDFPLVKLFMYVLFVIQWKSRHLKADQTSFLKPLAPEFELNKIVPWWQLQRGVGQRRRR